MRPHERILPRCRILDVALARLLRAHVMRTKGKFMASILVDVKHFYISIQFDDLIHNAKAASISVISASCSNANLCWGQIFER